MLRLADGSGRDRLLKLVVATQGVRQDVKSDRMPGRRPSSPQPEIETVEALNPTREGATDDTHPSEVSPRQWKSSLGRAVVTVILRSRAYDHETR
jgi:hypothetical protein